MLRVGMILDATFPPDPRVENEALTLIKHGFEVYLLCFGYDLQTDEQFEYQQIHVYRKSCDKLTYKLSALAYTVPFYHKITSKWIKDFIERYSIDVIHVHDIQIYRGVKYANKTGLPLVLDLHENRPEIMKYYSHVQRSLGKLLISPKVWKNQEYKAIREVDHLVVVTEEAKNFYESEVGIDPDKTIALPNTVRKGFYDNDKIEDDILQRFDEQFVILYVGDTGIRRGLLTAIDAVDALKDKIPELKLVIVGSNKSDKILKNRVNQLGLDAKILFEGWQKFETFPSYIEASDVCISPLYRNIHHDTTYANKIFQYMSMGKPVIVSDCPAQANVVQSANSGLIHEAENADQLADQVYYLYQNAGLREELGQNGKTFVRKEFSWEKKSQKLIKMYKKLQS